MLPGRLLQGANRLMAAYYNFVQSSRLSVIIQEDQAEALTLNFEEPLVCQRPDSSARMENSFTCADAIRGFQ
jgi:hypothetical protein